MHINLTAMQVRPTNAFKNREDANVQARAHARSALPTPSSLSHHHQRCLTHDLLVASMYAASVIAVTMSTLAMIGSSSHGRMGRT